MYDLSENDDFDREEIATYEEVARLFPRPGIFRPIVLIGPPGVGRNELKRRLIALDSERYKATVPRTYRKSNPIFFSILIFMNILIHTPLLIFLIDFRYLSSKQTR